MPTGEQTAQQPKTATGGKLTATVGATAAAMLLSMVPLMESGRKVVTQATPDHQVVIVSQQPIKYTHAYIDIAGVATVCDGLTHGVTRLTTKSPQQCMDMLDAQLNVDAVAVQSCTPLEKTRWGYQLAAFVDFAYNLGDRAWCHSSAAKRVRAGDVAGACDLLLRYNKARVHGRLVPVADLTRRRKREREYCRTGLFPGSTPTNLAARLKGL